jgi:hypothetical protein
MRDQRRLGRNMNLRTNRREWAPPRIDWPCWNLGAGITDYRQGSPPEQSSGSASPPTSLVKMCGFETDPLPMDWVVGQFELSFVMLPASGV